MPFWSPWPSTLISLVRSNLELGFSNDGDGVHGDAKKKIASASTVQESKGKEKNPAVAASCSAQPLATAPDSGDGPQQKRRKLMGAAPANSRDASGQEARNRQNIPRINFIRRFSDTV